MLVELKATHHAWLALFGLSIVLSCQGQTSQVCDVDTPFQLLALTSGSDAVAWRRGERLAYQVYEPGRTASALVTTDLCGEDRQPAADNIVAIKPVGESAFVACDFNGNVFRLDIATDERTPLASSAGCEFAIDDERGLAVVWADSDDPGYSNPLVFAEILADNPLPSPLTPPTLQQPFYDRRTGLLYGVGSNRELLRFDPTTNETTVEVADDVLDFLVFTRERMVFETCINSDCSNSTLWVRDTATDVTIPFEYTTLSASGFHTSPNGRYLVLSTFTTTATENYLIDMVEGTDIEIPPHDDVFGFFADNRLWLRDSFLGHIREFVWDPQSGARTDLLLLNDAYAYYSPLRRENYLEVIFGDEYGLLSGVLYRVELDGSPPVEVSAEVGRGYRHLPGDRLATVLNQRFDDFEDLYGELLGDLFILDLATGGGTYVDSDVLPLIWSWQADVLPDTLVYQVSAGSSPRTGLWAVRLPATAVSDL